MDPLLFVVLMASTAAGPQPPAGSLEPRPVRLIQVAAPQQETDPRDPVRHEAPEPPEGWLSDPRHRIETRFGVWRKPRFSWDEPEPDLHTGSADFAFGVEYLRSISQDVAVGVGMQARVRGSGERVEDGDSSSSGGTTVLIPFVVRWNFARRLTPWRTIEPYVTGNVGPLIRADWTASEIDDDDTSSANAETTLGARLGIGFDAHIGSVWTVGVTAAWNWSEEPDRPIGYGRHDRGGEVAVTMGWGWGRDRN
jgi:hypothetical protein